MTKCFATMPPILKYFLARQCPFSDILHNFIKVKQNDRHKLLSKIPKQQVIDICLITKFCPKIDHFNQTIKSNYHIQIEMKEGLEVSFLNIQYTLPNKLPTFVSFYAGILLLMVNLNAPIRVANVFKICKHTNTATKDFIHHKTINPSIITVNLLK